MSSEKKAACTKCGKQRVKSDLTVKRTQFREMGERGRVTKSRVEGWLCPSCLDRDPAFRAPAFGGKRAQA